MWQMLKLLCADQTLRDMFPQLTKLSTIAILIPISTAECEHAFSSMNCIKTELRNRLRTSTLDSLMRISIEGPPLSDFNFEEQLVCRVEYVTDNCQLAQVLQVHNFFGHAKAE